MAYIYMTTPNPFSFPFFTKMKQGRWLWIVYKYNICFFQLILESFKILKISTLINREERRGNIIAVTLQGIMHFLGTLIKILFTCNNFPFSIYTQFPF